MDLHEHLERVADRDTFLGFVRALAEDRAEEVRKEREKPSGTYGPGANGWESVTIEDYLGAALAWAADSVGRAGGLPEEPSWKAFATFLYCGKVYE